MTRRYPRRPRITRNSSGGCRHSGSSASRFDRGVTPDALKTLVLTVAHPERKAGDATAGVVPADPMATLQALPNIRVGRISLDERVDSVRG